MRQHSRRQFLVGSTALLGVPALLRASVLQPQQPLRLISAASDGPQHYLRAVEWLGLEVTELYRLALPARGHHVAVAPERGLFVAVARRPGAWLLLGDAVTGEVLQTVDLPHNRHCYGHGIFSLMQDRFYTTEQNLDDPHGDNGLVVEWLLGAEQGQPALQRGREMSTGGTGPHELVLLPDGNTLAVANGGLRTHPDTGREILNADSMQPSLTYLDRHSGEILEQVRPPAEFHQASIRHLDVNAEGQVAFGMQYQGEAWHSVPLVATHRRGGSLQLLEAPPQIQSAMHQYVGSVRFDTSGRYVGASCPRGNLLTFWDAATGSLHHSLRARDACGLQAADEGFYYSTGTGTLEHLHLPDLELTTLPVPEALRMPWDNHLSILPAGAVV